MESKNIYYREGLMRSCWSVDHTKRPTAPEIVEFLANNQRVIAPCLDVPLASVQLEHTGEMEMHLNTPADRKFSFPWSGQSFKSNSRASPIIDVPLLDINDSASTQDQSCKTVELESSRPLLGVTTDSCNGNSSVRYVNMQPGVSSAFLELPVTKPKIDGSSLHDVTNNTNNIALF